MITHRRLIGSFRSSGTYTLTSTTIIPSIAYAELYFPPHRRDRARLLNARS
jgi:hypothetical protein